MPIYEYECLKCNFPFEVSKSIAKFRSPENCPKCGEAAERQISKTSFILKGDGWPGKAGRVKNQMKTRRARLAQKEQDHVAAPMTLTPNVGGEQTDS